MMAIDSMQHLLAWVNGLPKPGPWALASVLLGYLVSVQLLRYRNLRYVQTKYARYIDNPYSMDYKTAHKILKTFLLREFPFVYGFSTQWALIKSYGIASGTKLLVQTRRLTSEDKVAKRSEDTSLFIAELLVSDLDSERGLRTLSKMNWIHSQYGSRITNGELIHTLALFILEPQRWIDEYEWRPMTELEKVAGFIYWREIGNRMGMQDIPKTLDEMKEWARTFEAEHMVYAPSNRACVVATINLFLRPVPDFLRAFAYNVSISFLEDHVRPVLGIKHPPWLIQTCTHCALKLRALFIRYFCLPRFRDMEIEAKPGTDGRLYRSSYLFEPWYVHETWWTRLLRKLPLSSGPLPGPEFKSNGYLPEELGPMEYEKRSRDAVLSQAAEMKGYAEAGGSMELRCPFTFAGSGGWRDIDNLRSEEGREGDG